MANVKCVHKEVFSISHLMGQHLVRHVPLKLPAMERQQSHLCLDTGDLQTRATTLSGVQIKPLALVETLYIQMGYAQSVMKG